MGDVQGFVEFRLLRGFVSVFSGFCARIKTNRDLIRFSPNVDWSC